MNKRYFYDSYNVFDFTIIIISCTIMILEKGNIVQLGN